MPNDALVAGIDGCRNGWVIVTTSSGVGGPARVDRVSHLGAVVPGNLLGGDWAVAAIDITIGLPASGPRRCDVEARSLIGDRRSSVFPAPPRGILGATSYPEACALARAINGKAVSKQLFAILPKIQEVDELITPELQERLVEVHPELSFTAMAGAPMSHHKRTLAGVLERVEALHPDFPGVETHAATRLPGVGVDDILDAFVAAWSARRYLAQSHIQIGGELDERGLRMEMIA